MVMNEINQAVKELRETADRLNATADSLAELLLRDGEWPGTAAPAKGEVPERSEGGRVAEPGNYKGRHEAMEAPKAAVFCPVPESEEDDNPFLPPVTTKVTVSTEIAGTKNLPAGEPEMDPAVTEGPAAPADPAPTLESVRAVLADASRAGHTSEIKALLTELGYARLSQVPAEHYPMLMAEGRRMLNNTNNTNGDTAGNHEN